MWKKRYSKKEIDFRQDIPNYSDQQLKEVLKQRKHYQPEAAKLAIQEALKREIIHSEQDLLSEEYRSKELQLSWFPKINKDRNREKIRKSIARNLVILAVLPIVYGLIEMNIRNNYYEGTAILLFGLFWLFCAAQLVKAFNPLIIKCLMIGNVLAVFYIVYRLVITRTVVFFDFFLLAVFAGLIFYGLVFLFKNK